MCIRVHWKFFIWLILALVFSLSTNGARAQALIDQQALGAASSSAVVLVDWDMDGDLDAIVTNAPPELKELWINDGRGRFSLFSANNGEYDVFPPFYIIEDRDVAVGDLDGDGLPDAVFPMNGVYFNRLTITANGTQVLATQRVDLPSSPVEKTLVRVVDLDGDGDLDVYLGSSLYGGCCEDEIIINSDGAGTFLLSGFTVGPSQPTTDAVFRDINGDGGIDIVLCHAFYSNATIWQSYNDGTANFTQYGELGTPCDGLDIGDIDGDGFDDLILVQLGGRDSIWRGFGNLTFEDTGQNPGNTTFSASVRLGDLNNDGYLDAIIANTIGTLFTGEPSEALLNDGLGNLFLIPPQPLFLPEGGKLGKWFSRRPALGDLDGDGLLDLFEANTVGQPNRVYKNVGSGLSATNPSANTTAGINVVLQFDATTPAFVMTPLEPSATETIADDGVRIEVHTIRETQGASGLTLIEVDLMTQTFMAFANPSLGDVGFDFIRVGPSGERYDFKFSLFKTAAVITYGKQTYDVDVDVNKITLKVNFWPFVNSSTSWLEFDIIIQPAVTGSFTFLTNATDPTAGIQGLERTIFETTRGHSVVISLLKTAAIDGVVTENFVRTYIMINDSYILLRLAFPAFEVELEYDPDVAILVDTRGNSKTDNTWVIIMASILSIAAVIGIGLIIAGTIGVVIVLKKVNNRLWNRRYRRASSGAIVFPESQEEYEKIKKSSSDEANTTMTEEGPNDVEMEVLEPLESFEQSPPASDRSGTDASTQV